MYVHQALLVVLRLGTGTAGYLSTVMSGLVLQRF